MKTLKQEQMIPKKIHYCWLSGETIPPNFQKCINSWKKIMPDYEIACWDTNKFDITSNLFVEEACKVKKWACASDYIRLYALYTEGGIYMDSDVIVRKKFDEYLNFDFFTAIEYHTSLVEEEKTLNLLNNDGTSKIPFTRKPGIGIQAAVLGSIKGHFFVKDCLEYFRDKHYVPNDKIIAPDIYAMIAEKYGFRYKNELQHLNGNILILPSKVFAGTISEATDNSYAIHYCAGSWRDKPNRSLLKKIFEKLKKNNHIRKIFWKQPINTIFEDVD